MDEKWYNFDDSHVTEVDEGNAKVSFLSRRMSVMDADNSIIVKGGLSSLLQTSTTNTITFTLTHLVIYHHLLLIYTSVQLHLPTVLLDYHICEASPYPFNSHATHPPTYLPHTRIHTHAHSTIKTYHHHHNDALKSVLFVC